MERDHTHERQGFTTANPPSPSSCPLVSPQSPSLPYCLLYDTFIKKRVEGRTETGDSLSLSPPLFHSLSLQTAHHCTIGEKQTRKEPRALRGSDRPPFPPHSLASLLPPLLSLFNHCRHRHRCRVFSSSVLVVLAWVPQLAMAVFVSPSSCPPARIHLNPRGSWRQ